MKTIKVGFSRPKKFKIFAFLIMKILKINYDHVYIRLHSDTYERDLIYQASKTMVNFMGSDIFDDENIVVKESVINMEDQDYKAMMQFAIDNAGKPYGVMSAVGLGIVKLIKQVFNKDINNPFGDGTTTWICDELVAYILKNFDSMNFNKNTDNLNPQDLYEQLS